MDRDQRDRGQRSGGASSRAPQKRSLGSRVGLQKQQQDGPAENRRPRPSASQGTQPRRKTPPQRNPQKPGYRAEPPRQTRRITQAEILRRRKRRRILGGLAVIAVLMVGVVLSINLLFKVTSFQVENMDGTTPADTGPYTEQQILDLLGVQAGDQLFSFSTAEKAEILQTGLPYLDEVSVVTSMPGTVVVRVSPAVERFAVPYSGGYLVVSDRMKILRVDSEWSDGLISLEAVVAANSGVTPGEFLRLSDGEETTGEETVADAAEQTETDAAVRMLLESLQKEGLLDGVSMISLNDINEIHFLYEGRVSVKLGTTNNLDYKMRLAAAALLDADGKGLSASDRGTLDVSYQREDGEIWAYFQPADPIQDEPAADDSQ